MSKYSYKSKAYVSNVYALGSKIKFPADFRCYETQCSTNQKVVYVNISHDI